MAYREGGGGTALGNGVPAHPCVALLVLLVPMRHHRHDAVRTLSSSSRHCFRHSSWLRLSTRLSMTCPGMQQRQHHNQGEALHEILGQ